VPATFVVDTRGQILFAQVDVDGRTRTQPAQVLAALRLVANGHREG
jgi:peroxiredoxin